MRKQPERSVLITDAARSPDDQYRSRQIRYVTMMGLRTLCVIAGAILVSVRPPLLPLWLILCAAGMVFLPWAAVLIANDRPAQTKEERAASAAARAPKPQPSLEPTAAQPVEYITIDVDPVDPVDSGSRRVPPERENN